MQALFMNLVPQSFRFFFNSGPKKVLYLHGIAERQRGRVLLVSRVIERAGDFSHKTPRRTLKSERKMASFLWEMTPFVRERR
jgi:hypothetical protein